MLSRITAVEMILLTPEAVQAPRIRAAVVLAPAAQVTVVILNTPITGYRRQRPSITMRNTRPSITMQ